MMPRQYLTYLSVLILSACTVGPDYSKPKVELPQEFVSQNVFALINTGNNENFPLEWWQGFNAPDLNDLIRKGLADNYDIAIAASRVRQARANIRFADSGDSLSVGASGGAEIEERRNLNDGGDSSTSTSFVGGLAALLPLDIFGQSEREVEAAQAQYQSAQAVLRGAILDVSTVIANEYLSLLGTQRQLELLKESVDLQNQTLSIVQARYDAGLAPDLDVQRARTSVQNLRADIPVLEQSLKNSRNRLATLTGEFPGYYEGLAKNITTIPDYDGAIPARVPYEVLAGRPDVAQAEANLRQAIARIGIAEAEFYPVFELRGNISVNATGFGTTPATDILIASLSGLIDQVLFDGGARAANLDITKAQAEEALAVYDQTLRQAALDVENVLAALQSSADRQISLEKSIISTQKSFKQAEILYQQGLISFLDVVDAQRQLASAEQALAREKTNYATQIVNLFNALGNT